ncbi:hypothetical protein JXB31_02885 [Candidatus Woesearchaeota archaeon]|nr:hypothetical protein [Candidatus Woesearchaeota archaeon]
MRAKKSQSSVEMVIVVGISLGVLLVSSFMLYNYALYSTNKIISDRVDDIGKSITQTAQIVDAYGVPARRVVEYNFPRGIKNMTIVGGNVLYFDMQLIGMESTQGYFSEVNITGSFLEDDYEEGKKKFRIECIGEQVIVERWKNG